MIRPMSHSSDAESEAIHRGNPAGDPGKPAESPAIPSESPPLRHPPLAEASERIGSRWGNWWGRVRARLDGKTASFLYSPGKSPRPFARAHESPPLPRSMGVVMGFDRHLGRAWVIG